MNAICEQKTIVPMSKTAIENIAALEKTVLSCPQVDIKTLHVLHAGMYTRTIVIPAGVVLTGALIKIPTMLTISGEALMSRGDEEGIHIKGTIVLPASAGRKQAFIAYQDTTISMSFCTKAKTVEQAEAEFTDDTDLLFSHRDPALNTVIITGE